jgi:glutamyl-tRNA synthetase
MPKFAHLPLILKPTGKGKLSKRDGEKGGFPVFPLQWKDPVSMETSPGYRDEGYLPEACINMLALLGWNPGTEQELFSLEQLIQEFQLEKVGRSGSRFDPEKTKWFNHQHIQLKSDKELLPAFQKVLKDNGVKLDEGRVELLVPIIKPRINFFHEVWEESWFFFRAPDSYDPEVVSKRWKEDTPGQMKELAAALEKCEPFTLESVETVVKATIAGNQWGMGAIMNAWRLLLVGAAKGPGLFDLAVFLGREEVLSRMHKGISLIVIKK